MCGCRSLERTATNATPASWWDASMMLMLPGAFVGGVTFVQVLPASRVRCTKPVLVPTQMTPRPAPDTGDGASAVIEPPGAGALTPVAAPVASAAVGVAFGLAKSGLILRHVRTLSLDARTYCAPM